MSRTIRCTLLTLTQIALVFTMVSLGLAQMQVATGTPRFTAFGGGPFDTVNLGNLNVHFSIPVLHKSGRGMPFTYDLSFDSSVWYSAPVSGVTTWQPVGNWGWRGITEASLGYLTYVDHKQKCPNLGDGYVWWRNTYVYHDMFGVAHAYGSTATLSDCNSNSFGFSETAADGSGYTLNVDDTGMRNTVTTAAGTVRVPPASSSGAGTATDANGNQITVSTAGVFTDTLGTTALTIAGSATPSSPLSFTYTNPSGTGSTLWVYYSSVPIKTNFGCSGIAEYTGTANLVGSIRLADGELYQFTYEPTPGFSGYYTGRLSSVILPTGGQIHYTYTGSNNGIICADGSTAGLTRQVTPGGTWTYTRSGSANTWSTTVGDPSSPSNQTVINFAKDSAAPSNPTNNFFETQRRVYQGSSSSGTLLLTVLTCYNNNFTNCATAAVASPITVVYAYKYIPGINYSLTSTVYNANGLPIDFKEWDYGADLGNGAGYTRHTVISYAALGNGIVDHPQQISVEDGSNNIKSQTTFYYDETAVTATSGTPQHVAVTGSRGNPTTIVSLVTAPSGGTLSRKFSYFDTGLVQTATDVNNAQTTYTYGFCGNSFVSSISMPLSLSTSMAWDCNGGVPLSSTDANSKTTSFAYDSLWRQIQVATPDTGQSNLHFNLTATPPNIQLTAKIDSSRVITKTTILDGLGRTKQTQLNSDPVNPVYTDTTYDANGRVATASNPYRSTSDPTYGLTTYSYDALNRPTQLKHPDNSTVVYGYTGASTGVQDEGNGSTRITRINRVDALGRLTNVCEVSSTTQMGSGGTPSACGLDIAGTGFLTTYGYDTLNNLISVTQGGQTRTYAYDALSRLMQETGPESWAIPTTYTYDSCGGGNMCTRKAPKPNQASNTVFVTTTYTYDALHRLTSKSYDDGTNSNSFVYDQATFWGATLTNSKGRLSAATVGAGLYGTIFSYDSMGRTLNQWQTKPQGGSYVLGYSYDLLGDVTSMNNGVNITFSSSYNTAAQLTGLTSSLSDATHPGTLLSGVNYNALGAVSSATFGNGLPETATYYQRGWLQSVAVGSGGSTYSFSLGYAANGDLLTGNDSFNGNWGYTYDDLNRLATSGKTQQGVTVQGFNYKYDRYGNRWQQNLTAGQGPAPNYSFDGLNHLASGQGVYVDAAGNVVNDGAHTYTFDAEGRMMTVDGGSTASYLYDALGRRIRVTTASSGAIDQVLDMGGRLLARVNAASGVTILDEIYAGGRHLASYGNNTTYFDHADWLGTVRMRTDPSGSIVDNCSSLAFGDGMSCGPTDASAIHFTGLERDSESGLDHTLFRQYSSTEGRWLTPDPAGMGAVDPANPQSWNRYAYVMNRPTVATDPLGLGECDSQMMCQEVDGGGGGGSIAEWSNGGGGSGSGGGGGSEAGGTGQNPAWAAANATWWNSTFSAANSQIPNQLQQNAINDAQFFGDKYYDLPGNANPGAQAEAHYGAQVASAFAANNEPFLRNYIREVHTLVKYTGEMTNCETHYGITMCDFSVAPNCSAGYTWAPSIVGDSPPPLAGWWVGGLCVRLGSGYPWVCGPVVNGTALKTTQTTPGDCTVLPK